MVSQRTAVSGSLLCDIPPAPRPTRLACYRHLQAMERVSLGSVKVAGILLVGLFIYDVTWVYG